MTNYPSGLLLALMTGLTLVGCGGGSDGNNTPPPPPPVVTDAPSTVSEAISQLNQSGQLPELDRTGTLSGIDNDSNGIRDDIDNYINSLSLLTAQKSALVDFAGDLQAIQSIDLTDAGSVQSISALVAQSVVCLNAAYDNPADAYALLSKLEAYTANTRERAEQYIGYNAARDGAVTRLPGSATCQ